MIISIKDLSLIFQNSKKKKLRLNFDYRAKLSMIVRTWKKGLINYAISQGFSHALSSNLVNSMIELVHKNAEIHQIQELKELILISATKGGLLKTAIDHINMKIHPLVNIILDKFNCQNLKKNYLLLENMVKETCNAVLTHATLELQK